MSNTDEIYAAATPTPWEISHAPADGYVDILGPLLSDGQPSVLIDVEEDDSALIVHAVNNFRRVKAERDQALAEAALLESEAVRAHEDFVDLAGKHEALKVASRALLDAPSRDGRLLLEKRKALEELL